MSSISETTSKSSRAFSVWALIRAMRPAQVPKNGLVLVPMLFSINIWYSPQDWSGMAEIVLRSIGATVVFAILSGSVYILNDLSDVERDRVHPRKRHRAIASGALSVRIAYVAALSGIVVSMAVAGFIGVSLLSVAGAYLITNIAYTLWWKRVMLIDVITVTSGFLLRALAGALVIDGVLILQDGEVLPIDISVSPWLYVVTGLGALLLALSKRRAELKSAGESAAGQRDVLSEYSLQLLDMLISITASSALIAYTLYTFNFGESGGNVPIDKTMMFTIPFVGYGIFRYIYLLYVKGDGEAPEAILMRDIPTIVNVALWLLVSGGILLWHTL